MRIKRIILVILLLSTGIALFSIPVPDNNCLNLDGTNDYVTLANESLYDFESDFTLEFWIKVDEWTRPWQAIITKGDNAWRVHRYNETDNICFTVDQGTAITTTAINDSQWHHIVCVKYVDNIIYLFVDGNLEDTDGSLGFYANDYSVMIGENAQVTGRYFKGQIDDIRIFNYGKYIDLPVGQIESEINHRAHNAPNLSDPGLVAYFDINESSGNTINNQISSNNGTVYGAGFVPSGTPVGPEWVGSLDWDSFYYVEDPCTFIYDTTKVYSNLRIYQSLTVNPGVTVEFQGNWQIKMWADGYINACGTETDSIRFTVADTTGFMSMEDENDVAGGWGGLRLLFGDTHIFNHCIFEYGKANYASHFGGAISISGNSIIELSNSRFSNNISAAGGGAIGLMDDYCGVADLINCKFENNIAWGRDSFSGQGGAIYSENKDLSISSCQFYNNSASDDGGALYFDNGNKPIDFFHNIVAGNTAGNGGAVWIKDYDGDTFYNNIFADNNATNGGAFYFSGNADMTLRNNIIFGNTATDEGDQIYLESTSSDPSFEYSIIEGGLEDFEGAGANNCGGTYLSCSDRDPLFTGSGDHPYNISDLSPCINAGKPGSTAGDYDLLGNPRIFTAGASGDAAIDVILNTIDIGSYENQQDLGILPYDFSLNSNVSLQHDITIINGNTFTVNADIDFDPEVGMDIYGSLFAEGESSNLIEMNRISTANNKPILSFFGPSSEENFSQLDYCSFSQPGNPGTNIQYGGAIYVENYDNLLIRNSFFEYGKAEYGGAVAFNNSSAEMNSCFFLLTESTISGGAIYCLNASPILSNLTIFHNSSLGSFGAIAADSQSDPSIYSCIIWDNGDTPVSTDLDVKYSDVEGGYEGVQNIDADPCFIYTHDIYNPDVGLKSHSPCLNAGKIDTSDLNMPDYDYYGNPRIHQHTNSYYNRVDMGVAEYGGLMQPSNFQASDGDNNYPGYVYLTWEFNSSYNPLNGFQIYRDDILINTVYPQSRSFSDDEATPGVVSTYAVVAYAGSEVSVASEDQGYLKPNGIITGTVLTTNNNPVAEVIVSIEPSPGYCLQLQQSNQFWIETEDLSLQENLTMEFWLKTPNSDFNVLYFIDEINWEKVCGLDIDADGNLVYTNDVVSIVQEVDSLIVNDNEWHHLAIVSEFTDNRTRMYIDAQLVADSLITIDLSLAHYLVSNEDGGLLGYFDDLRLWSTARTQEDIAFYKDIVAPWNSDGLIGYWGMNEGTGEVCFDATNFNNSCAFQNCDWSSDEPGLILCGITTNWGEYNISQIPYGNYTTFTVTPYKEDHFFQPEQRIITLSASNISQNNVDFTDNSMIPISGRIMFQNTLEPVQEAYILLNGVNTIPPTMTNEEGYYVMDVEHGTDCVLSVGYNEHEFNRIWDLGVVTFPQANKHFEDVTRTCFMVEVFGGDDNYPIGAFDVNLISMSGLYSDSLSASFFGGQWIGGNVIIDNIPPLNYHVTVTPNSSVDPGDPFSLMTDQQFIDLHTQDVDLRYPVLNDTLITVQDTLTYTWYNGLQVEVEWPDDYELKYFASYPDSGFYVIPQNEWIALEVRAFEDYEYDDNGHITYLDDCDISINDQVGPTGEFESAFVDTTIFYYEFAPYLPNILEGGERPYQNIFEVVVYDPVLQRHAVQTDWVITEGTKPQETTFASTSPEIPFLVLHDPPGDESYASFNQTSSNSTAMSISVDRAQSSTFDATVHLGLDIVQSIGIMYSSQIEFNSTLDLSYGYTCQEHQSHIDERLWSFTTSEEYTTSDDDQLIGVESDLFVGGAVNLLWGLTKVLTWNDTTNTVDLLDDIMVTPDGFATVYIYTESQIRLNVIPNLITIGDTTSAGLWQSYLDMNNDNIANAVVNSNHPGNLSFNAGAGYTYEETSTFTESHNFTFETNTSTELGIQLGAIVNGIGWSGGYKFSTTITYGKSQTETYETSSTITYVLSDDDETSTLNFVPDYFTIDIKKDPVYGTPVFQLLGGASSNRWEPNTLPRAGVNFAANTFAVHGLQEGEEAAFLLYLGNTTQNEEFRRYYLSLHHESNPCGATVKINGLPFNDDFPIDIPANEQVQVIMTVAQGPTAYEYDDLQLEFYDPGDRGHEGPIGHNFYMFKEFDVSWEPPYSKVSIFSPNENWIINAANDDTLEIVLNEYNLSKPTFESIKFQYKHPYDNTWFTANQIYREELEQLSTTYAVIDWDVSQISDGDYLIRAGTTDSLQADYYCNPVPGHIDRNIPEVMGIPQPGDGIFSLGDEISVYFTEFIDPVYIDYFATSLVINRTGEPIDIDIDCFENKVTLVPLSSNYYFENETLTATVEGIFDMYGNSLDEPIQWEFYVNANPVYWNIPKIEIIKPFGESMEVTSQLINSGGQFSSWTIDNLPEWLTADVNTGTLLPLDSETITFTISNELSFGTFLDTVYADIPALGREPLIFEISVLANPPEWATTQLNIYDYSMTITGELFMEDELSIDPNDIIGAFTINENDEYECRGFAPLQLCPYFPDTYQFYLSVHSNETLYEDLVFRVWDASTSKEHFGITEQYDFVSGAIYGTILEPETIHVSPELIRSIECRSGWSWISVNLINPVSMDLDTVFVSLSPQQNDMVKNQTSYAQYVPGDGWLGSLTEISTTEMVKINLLNLDELQIVGLLEDVNTTPITYGSGWNWIGYLPHFSFSVNQALANIPNLTTGDLIKNQNGYAQYVDGYGWFGSLLFMHAGDGFMLNTADSGSFYYPDNSALNDNGNMFVESRDKKKLVPIFDIAGWNIDPLNFEFSSNITAVVSNNDTILNSENIMLGAFYDNECRGVAVSVNVQGQWTFFLTQYANVENEIFNYKVYYIDEEMEEALEESLQFTDNQILGDPLNPFVFHQMDGGLSAPVNVRLIIHNDQVELYWDAVAGASAYHVYSCNTPDGTFTDISANGSFTDTSWISTEPLGSKKFFYITASSE